MNLCLYSLFVCEGYEDTKVFDSIYGLFARQSSLREIANERTNGQ